MFADLEVGREEEQLAGRVRQIPMTANTLASATRDPERARQPGRERRSPDDGDEDGEGEEEERQRSASGSRPRDQSSETAANAAKRRGAGSADRARKRRHVRIAHHADEAGEGDAAAARTP